MRVFKTKLIRLQLTAEELDALTADFMEGANKFLI